MDIPKDVQLAIDYAARDVARAIVDSYKCQSEFRPFARNIAFMLKAASASAISQVIRKSEVWIDPSAKGWLSRVADVGPGGVDKDALTAAVQDWWGELDDNAKYQTIMATHPDTQFMNEQVQKLMNKTEGDISKVDARLLEIYRTKAGNTQKPKPEAPANENLPPEKEKAPEAQRPLPEQGNDGGQKSQPEPMQPLQNNK